ncbi:MAG TPA: monooxygenase, partial [Hyphomicrobiaceae bacterium]|nr:monooxygenase [Hyphomicrobiaceae bacterium]
MALDIDHSDTSATQVVADWLKQFEQALVAGDAAAAAEMFVADGGWPQGHWRDVLAFTWTLDTMNGRTAIAGMLAKTMAEAGAHNFRLAEGRTPPRLLKRVGLTCIEALIEFETEIGKGHGALRLVPSAQEGGFARAWILMTCLEEIAGHEEKIEGRRPGSEAFSRDFGGNNWLDLRE